MLINICGRSRSGKTTFSKHFKNVIHLDQYGAGDIAYKKVQSVVAHSTDKDVVVEGIYDTAARRMALISAYKGDDDKTCIWLDTALDVIEDRFGKEKPDDLPHPFEEPSVNEGWKQIVIIKDH